MQFTFVFVSFQDNFEFDIGMLVVLAVSFRIAAFFFLLLKTYRKK